MSGNDFCTFGIWEWEIAKYIPNFWDWEWERKILFPNFGIGNGNERFNSQLLGLGMGMKKVFQTQPGKKLPK